MYDFLVNILRNFNEFLTAGIAITAFSLLIYALSFNLRDRVARSFALILLCVVFVFVADAIGSVSNTPEGQRFWFFLQWPGIIFLPATYIHLSDALLATTGRPSRGRRRIAVLLAYLISGLFLLSLPWLLDDLVLEPIPHLRPNWFTWLFTVYYIAGMVLAWSNFIRAYRRTVTSASRRRMSYLVIGALAPALGLFPFLVVSPRFASASPLFFWLAVVISNILISIFLVLMAYAVAFFGVPWPDRVVKRRLFKWLMRGPVTASTALLLTTLVRRSGLVLGYDLSALAPVMMVATILIFEHLITLVAPVWERWLFYGRDRADVELLQAIEERLLTSSDLYQFLESILAAVCDRLQSSQAFLATLGGQGAELFVTIGGDQILEKEDLSVDVLKMATQNGFSELFTWGMYWLVPLSNDDNDELLGLMGVTQTPDRTPDQEQLKDLRILADRAAMALQDRKRQQQVFSSLEDLTSQVDLIQRLRAASRYDSTEILITPEPPLEEDSFPRWVKDALTHYWGGPKLTESPLLELEVVQQSVRENEDTPVNALRSILRKAIEKTRPEGERRYTSEWLIYNLLEMKFLEGRKVREIAMRLALSEADLYRKQRVAVEAVANVIIEMESHARNGATITANITT